MVDRFAYDFAHLYLCFFSADGFYIEVSFAAEQHAVIDLDMRQGKRVHESGDKVRIFSSPSVNKHLIGAEDVFHFFHIVCQFEEIPEQHS